MENIMLYELIQSEDYKGLNDLLKLKEPICVSELLTCLESTKDSNIRNKIAMLLSESKCNDAIEVLIRLINKPELKNQRGSLIYALANLEISEEQLIQLLPLIYEGNYEVRVSIKTVIEENYSKLSKEGMVRCLIMLQGQIHEYEMTLSLMEDVKEDLIDNLG